MQNVLAPYALESIIYIAKYLPLNVSTDASNIGNNKLIRYCNIDKDEQPIVHALIEFKLTRGETSEDIFNVIKSTVDYTELPFENITSFGADNAPVNFKCFYKIKNI